MEMFEQATVKDAFQMDYAFVIGPMLVSFTEWLLEKAKEDGVKRLYFLARDGYALYHVAKLLLAQSNENIDCRYLHCSRYSLRMAEYHLDITKAIEYISLDGIEITFYRMMKRAGLSLSVTEQVAQEISYYESVHTVIGRKQIGIIREQLIHSTTFIEYISKHSCKEYPLTMGYLEQEGLLGEIPFGIVDSGWVGSMQRSLEKLIRTKKAEATIKGYYFGLYEIPKDQNNNNYRSYYFSPKRNILRKTYFSNNLFECICSSEEGMTVSYIHTKDGYQPVFEKESNPNQDQIRRGLTALRLYTAYYLNQKSTSQREVMPEEHLETLEDLLYYFSGHPVYEEVSFFGNFVFCDDVIGEQNQNLAAKLQASDVKDQYIARRIKAKLSPDKHRKNESAWIYGSIVRIRKKPNAQIERAALGRYALYLLKNLQL